MLEMVGILCGLIICLLYYYLTASYNFWKKLNIPGPSPTLFFGTMKDVILCRKLSDRYMKNVCDVYEHTPFVGIFEMREPILIIKDPKYAKDVLIRDAAIFSSRGIPPVVEVELMNNSFFFANGTVAQAMRSKMSSIFTPNKLKDMFRIMLKSIGRLDNYLEELLPKNGHEINCTVMAFKLTADMVGNTLIGIDMKTLTNGTTKGNEILTFCKMMRGTYWGSLTKMIIRRTSSRLYYYINYYLLNYVKTTQNFVNFIYNIMKYRKEHGIDKSDVISLMMELKEDPKHFAELCGMDVTDEFIVAQVYMMFFAAYESSGVIICYTLYELALNKNIQDKLREEILDLYARNHNIMEYESLNALPYLNAVIKETLRKYPLVGLVPRQASSSYTFKNTNITIPKNQIVIIPVYAFHYDPKIYPQPEIYDPKRFIGETAHLKHSIYFSPFGHGLRNCIGERLGILQIKMALVGILRNYKLDVCKKTVTSFTHRTRKFMNMPDVHVFLKMTKIN